MPSFTSGCLVALAVLFLCLPQLAMGAVREYNLTIAPGWLAPDGHWRKVWTVNGQTPGPTIECEEGDTLRVNVQNSAPVAITMHFHGQIQRKPWYDGVPGVTQYPILSQGEFSYEFVAEPYGIYWYHSHVSGTYDDGIRGPLLVRPKAERQRPWKEISADTAEQEEIEEAYQAAEPIMLVNWRHEDMDSALTRYRVTGQDPLCLDSVLINGQGRVHCPTAELLKEQASVPNMLGGPDVRGCVGLPWSFVNATTHNNPPTCQNTTSAYPLFTPKASKNGKFAALHLISAGGDLQMSFSIDAHDMWIVAADGEFVKPQKVKAVDILLGNRYTVIVPLDQPKGDYTIRSPVSPTIGIQILSAYGVWQVEGGIEASINDTTTAIASTGARPGPQKRQSQPTVSVGTNTAPPAGESAYPGVVTGCVEMGSTCVYQAVPTTEPFYEPTQSPQPAGTSSSSVPTPVAMGSNGFSTAGAQAQQVVNDLPSVTDPSKIWLQYNGTAINNATYQNDSLLAPYPAAPAPKGKADYTFLLHVNLTNAVTWNLSPTDKPFQSLRYYQEPILFQDQKAFNADQYDGTVLEIKNGSIVDFIYNSDMIALGNNPAHPIHKHQTKVWVLGESKPMVMGAFPYDSVEKAEQEAPGLLNFDTAPRRDGWNVPSGGWVVTRHLVEFPSSTLLHCHIQQHLAAGMAIVLREGMDLFDPQQIPSKIRNAPHAVATSIPQQHIGLDEL